MTDLFDKELLNKVKLLVEEHKQKTNRILTFRVTIDADKNIMVIVNNIYENRWWNLREDFKTRLLAVEEAVKKEKDKINRDLADRWEYLSALEKDLRALKTSLMESGLYE